jgi:hypothetical protein
VQANKRQRGWAQIGRRMGIWTHMLGSIPYLSSPASDNPLGMALHAHATCSSYTGADKGAQVPPFSQHWSAKWWYSGTEVKCLAHPVCAVSHRLRNRGHDRLGPHDFCCAASRWFRIMVMIASAPVTSTTQ